MFSKYLLNFKKFPRKFFRIYSSNKTTKDNTPKIEIPPEPTTCCMSGCANCVWIEYAETLSKLYQDGGEQAKKLILDKIQDPNMRAYLATELKALDRLKHAQNSATENDKPNSPPKNI